MSALANYQYFPSFAMLPQAGDDVDASYFSENGQARGLSDSKS